MKERRKSECFLIILYYFTIQPATEQCTVGLFPCVTVDTDKHGVIVREDCLVLSDNVKQVNTTGLNGFTDVHISWGEREGEGEKDGGRERGRKREGEKEGGKKEKGKEGREEEK